MNGPPVLTQPSQDVQAGIAGPFRDQSTAGELGSPARQRTGATLQTGPLQRSGAVEASSAPEPEHVDFEPLLGMLLVGTNEATKTGVATTAAATGGKPNGETETPFGGKIIMPNSEPTLIAAMPSTGIQPSTSTGMAENGAEGDGPIGAVTVGDAGSLVPGTATVQRVTPSKGHHVVTDSGAGGNQSQGKLNPLIAPSHSQQVAHTMSSGGKSGDETGSSLAPAQPDRGAATISPLHTLADNGKSADEITMDRPEIEESVSLRRSEGNSTGRLDGKSAAHRVLTPLSPGKAGMQPNGLQINSMQEGGPTMSDRPAAAVLDAHTGNPSDQSATFGSAPDGFSDAGPEAGSGVGNAVKGTRAFGNGGAGPSAAAEPRGGTVSSQIGDSIGAHSRMLSRTGETRFELQLHPPELGRVWIHLTESGDGLAARIIAADDAARQTIESQLTDLRQSIANTGVMLQDLDISQQGQGTFDDGSGEPPRPFLGLPADLNETSASQSAVPAHSFGGTGQKINLTA